MHMSPTPLQRIVPYFRKARVARVLLEREEKELTPALYLSRIEAFERKCEQTLIETLRRLHIKASVKTNRYSLPYKEEVLVILPGESFLNAAFNLTRVTRVVARDLLNRDLYKVRFYLHINVVEDPAYSLGKVEYRFRYYPQ